MGNFFYWYNPHKHLLKYHFFQIESEIVFYLRHKNLIILGDLDAEISDHNLESFSTINNHECIIEEPTCFK